MNCHKNRRNSDTYVLTNVSSSHWGPHGSVQADNFFGRNAATFNNTPFLSNAHQFAVTDACVTCHMVATADTGTVNRDKVGGHSWNLHNPASGYDHTAACTNCHGPKNSFEDFEASMDYDGDGSIEAIQSEVDGLLAKIRFLLPPTGIDSVSWEMIRDLNDLTIKKAFYNYNMIMNDGSRGMHNSKFAFDVLTQTQNALGFVSVEEEPTNTVTSYSLSQNYPNPFNPSTEINFSIPVQSNVKIIIYDALGNQLEVIANEVKSAGSYSVRWNAGNYASGIYFYKLEADNFVQVRKMILMK